MNESAIWLANTESQNNCRISQRMGITSGFTVEISSRYHGHLIYDVKRNTCSKIDGMRNKRNFWSNDNCNEARNRNKFWYSLWCFLGRPTDGVVIQDRHSIQFKI